MTTGPAPQVATSKTAAFTYSSNAAIAPPPRSTIISIRPKYGPRTPQERCVVRGLTEINQQAASLNDDRATLRCRSIRRSGGYS